MDWVWSSVQTLHEHEICGNIVNRTLYGFIWNSDFNSLIMKQIHKIQVQDTHSVRISEIHTHSTCLNSYRKEHYLFVCLSICSHRGRMSPEKTENCDIKLCESSLLPPRLGNDQQLIRMNIALLKQVDNLSSYSIIHFLEIFFSVLIISPNNYVVYLCLPQKTTYATVCILKINERELNWCIWLLKFLLIDKLLD